jgi:hypothetical protein
MAKEILAHHADLLQYWALSLPSDPQNRKGLETGKLRIATSGA